MLSENQLHLINKIPVKRRFEVSTNSEDLLLYLKKNKGKTCKDMKPIFMIEEYREYANTQIRKLTSDEIQKYMSERFEEGLAFLKSIERGKCFIEYIPAKSIYLQSKEEAQNAPIPITTYALFLEGNYITNEQMNDKRFLKLLEK